MPSHDPVIADNLDSMDGCEVPCWTQVCEIDQQNNQMVRFCSQHGVSGPLQALEAVYFCSSLRCEFFEAWQLGSLKPSH